MSELTLTSDLPYAIDIGHSFVQHTVGTHYAPFTVSKVKARGPYTTAKATANGPLAVITTGGPKYGPFKLQAETEVKAPFGQSGRGD